MAFTIATNGEEVEILVAQSDEVKTAVAWELGAAALNVLSETQVSPTEAPLIPIILNGTVYPGDIDHIGIEFREVAFLILRFTDDAENEIHGITYFVYVMPTSGRWVVHPTVIADDATDADNLFGRLTVQDQLGFFFSE